MSRLVTCLYDNEPLSIAADAVQRSAVLAESARALPPQCGPLPVPHARPYVEAWALQRLPALANSTDLLQVCKVRYCSHHHASCQQHSSCDVLTAGARPPTKMPSLKLHHLATCHLVISCFLWP